MGGGGWVVYSEFSVLLWSKALVLDLDQAEQLGAYHSLKILKCNITALFFCYRCALAKYVNKSITNRRLQPSRHEKTMS